LENAEARWKHPWEVWAWLKRAGEFDPENGSIGKILKRRLSKFFKKKGGFEIQ